MSEMNSDILIENIRMLRERDGLTQKQLADVAGMTQANISKALNPDDKRCFTLEQVYRIATHFRVSIDELTGNKTAERAALSPRSVLRFLVELLRTDNARITMFTREEEVFAVEYEWDGPSLDHSNRDIEYPAVYFPSYYEFDTTGMSFQEEQELYAEFSQCGNATSYCEMNEIIKKLLPMIELYKKEEIPEEAFMMIVEGYLKKLRN